MADLKFKIKTEADLKALQETKSGLEAATKATKALGQDTAALEDQIKQVDAALNSEAANAVRAAEGLKKAINSTRQAKGDTKQLEEQLKNIQGKHGLNSSNPISKAADFLSESASKLPGADTFQKIFNGSSALVAGVGLAFAGAAKGVNEYAKAEQQVTGLDAALAQNGLLTDAYREQLQALAGQLQTTTGVADDEWVGVLTRLTQFGSKPETIGIDAEAVKNLAGLLGGDIVQAAEAYSRALQGNYEIFSRYGIKVEEAGSQTERLQSLQEQLALRGGGQLEASNQTLIGQYQQFKNGLGDFFEAIGRWIAQTGILQSVLYGLATTLAWLAELLGGFVPKMDGMRNALQSTVPAAGEAEKALKSYGEEVKEQTELSAAYEAALKREIAAIQAKQRAQDEVANAQMALKLSAVDAQEQTGEISQSEATRRRAEIRANAENEKYHRDLAEQTQIMEASKKEQAREQEKVMDASKAVETAEAAKVRIEARDKAIREASKLGGQDVGFWEGQKAGLEGFQDLAGFPFQKYSIPALGMELSSMDNNVYQKIEEAFRQIDARIRSAQIKQRSDVVRAEQATPLEPGDAGLAGTLPHRRKVFEDTSRSSQTRISELEDEIQQAQATINLLTTKKLITDPTGRFQTAAAIQQAQTKQVAEPLPTGSKVTDQMAQEYQKIANENLKLKDMIATLGRFIETRGYADEQQLKLIADGQRNLEALIKRMDQLQTRMNINRP